MQMFRLHLKCEWNVSGRNIGRTFCQSLKCSQHVNTCFHRPSPPVSITFNDHKSRYPQAKHKLYGLFCALKHTQLYTIRVKKLVVKMDTKFIKSMINNPTLHPNNTINHWISVILLFDFELVHVPAEKHTGADGLSQWPQSTEDPSLEDPDNLKDWIDTNAGFLLKLTTLLSDLDPSPPLSLASSSYSALSMKARPSFSRPSSSSFVYDIDSKSKIPCLNKVMHWDKKLLTIQWFLDNPERPPDLTDEQFWLFIRQAMDYFVYGGKLFQKSHKGKSQLVPPPSDRLRLIAYAHNNLGHKGIFTMTRNLLIHFWWPHLTNNICWYTRTCHECQVCQTGYFHTPLSSLKSLRCSEKHISTLSSCLRLGPTTMVSTLNVLSHWGQGPLETGDYMVETLWN